MATRAEPGLFVLACRVEGETQVDQRRTVPVNSALGGPICIRTSRGTKSKRLRRSRLDLQAPRTYPTRRVKTRRPALEGPRCGSDETCARQSTAALGEDQP